MSAPTTPGQIGLTTTVAYKLVGDSSYTTFAQAMDVEESMSVGSVEVPLLSATAKRKLPTVLDAGDLTFTLAYFTNDPGAIALKTLLLTPVMVSFKVTYPDTGTDVFTGFLTGWDVSGIEQESVIEASVTITIDGAPTFTHA